MRWFWFGVIAGLLLQFDAPVVLALTLVQQPIIVAFVVGIVARPAIARRARRWVA